MNWKRALWMGVLAYVASFIVGIILAAALGFELTTASEPPAALWYWGIAFTAIIMGAFTWWFFTKEKPNWKDGLYFGLIAIAIGFVLDFLFFLPVVISSGSFSDLSKYYANSLFFVTLVVLLGVTTLVGWYKARN